MQDTGHTVMGELRTRAQNGEAARRLARAGNRYQPWAVGAKEGGSVIRSNSYGKLTPERSCPVRLESWRGDTDTPKMLPTVNAQALLLSTPHEPPPWLPLAKLNWKLTDRSLETTIFESLSLGSTEESRVRVKQGSGSKPPGNQDNPMHPFPFLLFSTKVTSGKSLQINRHSTDTFFLWLIAYLWDYSALSEYSFSHILKGDWHHFSYNYPEHHLREWTWSSFVNEKPE